MAVTLSLTEAQFFAALRAVLLGMLPPGTVVIRGEVNRVAEPSADNFVVMSPIMRDRLSTNVDTYTDLPLAIPPIGTRDSAASTQVTVQLDIHGPLSADWAQIIATLFRDEYATIEFTRTGYDIQPLYADDPRQVPFENAEQQTEWRWTIDVVLQSTPIVSTPQDFADAVNVGLIEVDGTYPP